MLYYFAMNFLRTRIRLLLFLIGIGAAVWAVSRLPSLWKPMPDLRSDANNVIVLIPDGCSQSMATLTRWCRGGPLALDLIQSGAVRTHSADSLVTDSAAAATALACGVKTDNGSLGVAPAPDAPFRPADLTYAPGQPIATVLEGAKRSGRSVGLVVTVDVWDATPAGVVAHTASRKSDAVIREQMLYQDLDVVFGGGREMLRPSSGATNESPQRVLQAHGVRIVTTAAEMEGVSTGKVWGLFAPNDLAPEIDRAAIAPEEPSLAQMTAKALALLKQNRHGFFLLVEGSQVDRAAHANDPARAMHDFQAFDDAVAVAMAFASGEGRGRTLVIACPDHDTGGLTIGQRTRTPRSAANLTAPLAGMQLSAKALAAKIGADQSVANIMAHVDAWWSIRLTTDEASEIASRAAGLGLERALDEVVSRQHTAIGWTSFGHTGVDVPLWSYGPGRPVGLIDNTDVAHAMAHALQLDLPALTRTLFVDALQAFPSARVDTADPAHPVLVVGTARLPINRNLLLRNGREERLDGLVVLSESTGRVYLPQSSVDRLRKQ